MSNKSLNSYARFSIKRLLSLITISTRKSSKLINGLLIEFIGLKGINFQPTKIIKIIPATLTGTPTRAKSKKLKSTFEYSPLISEIIIFGGVPILVFIPPRIDAKARGIRNFEGFHSIF